MSKILVDNLPQGFHAHFNKRLVGYTQPEPEGSVTLRFADGTTAQADLLIGADGVNSTTREIMYTDFAESAMKAGNVEEAERLRQHIPASWTGTYAYRSLLNTEKFLEYAPGHQAATVPLFVRAPFNNFRRNINLPVIRSIWERTDI